MVKATIIKTIPINMFVVKTPIIPMIKPIYTSIVVFLKGSPFKNGK